MLNAIAAVPAEALSWIASILASLIVAVVLPLIYKLFKIKIDDGRRALIEAAIQNGIRWALQKAIEASARAGDTRSSDSLQTIASKAIVDPTIVVDNAKTYVRDGVSETLGKLGVTDEALTSRIEARMPELLNKLRHGGSLL